MNTWVLIIIYAFTVGNVEHRQIRFVAQPSYEKCIEQLNIEWRKHEGEPHWYAGCRPLGKKV